MNSQSKSCSVMRFGRAAWLALAFCVIGSFGAGAVVAQDPEQYAIKKAQTDIEQKIKRDEGGSSPDVSFDRNAEVSQLSNAETKVTGDGRYSRDGKDRVRAFHYHAVINIRSGNVVRSDYDFILDDDNSGGGSGDPETTAIGAVQEAVKAKFSREQRGLLLYFSTDTQFYQVSNAENGVRGTAEVRRNVDDNNPRQMDYEGVYNIRTGKVTSSKYNIRR